MRLLVAAITFAITIGGLFFIDAQRIIDKNSKNYAQIVDALKNNAVSGTLAPRSTTRQTSVPVIQESSATATPSAPPAIEANETLAETSTPTLILTPTPTPEPSTIPAFTPTQAPAAIQTPSSSHVFYTSSHSRSTKYYCDTDSAWKDLSAKYLKQFSSETELLAIYPGKTLNKPCK